MGRTLLGPELQVPQFTRLIHEIHRRSLWQVLGIYVVGAWVVYQVILGLVQGLNLPEWLPPTAIILFLIGLPIVLATAFVQEGAPVPGLAPEPRETAIARDELHHRLFTWRNATLGGVMAFALWGVVAAIWMVMGAAPGPDGKAKTGKSIAVLPFKNLSASADDQFFADGVHEEILTRLANVGDLKVISRTSVMEYRDTKKNLRAIAQELGVGAILEGSVRRADDRVRITAQLIDARTDEHLWAETYERPLKDVFAIQAEVADRIAASLKARLSPTERERIADQPTENLQAYELYLKGLSYRANTSSENFAVADQLFTRAVELDPQFTHAHAALASLHCSTVQFGFDRSPERLQRAKVSLERAQQLNADLPQVRHAAARYYYYCLRDYDRALSELQVIARELPNDVDVLRVQGFIARRQGKYDQAMSQLETALEIDPRNSNTAYNLGLLYLGARRFDDATRALERAIAISPDYEAAYLSLTGLKLTLGDTAAARATLSRLPTRTSGVTEAWIRYFWYRRDGKAGLQRLAEAGIPVFAGQGSYVPTALWRARLCTVAGDATCARSAYDSVRVQVEREVGARPDDARLHATLGLAYAGLGRKADAIREADAAVKLLPITKDATEGVLYEENRARVFALLGESAKAVEALRHLLSIPSSISVSMLRTSPEWDRLRQHPDFQKLIAEAK